MTFAEFRCTHTELPISGCDHCRTPAKPQPKPKTTAKKRVPAPRIPKEPTMPARTTPALDTKNWEPLAACRQPGADPEWWDASPNTTESFKARTWCKERCPVITQCLELAMQAEGRAAASHRFGVYGGLTGAERRDLYDQRRKATA